MLILNLKTYPESTGANLDKLLSAIVEAQTENPRLKELVYVAPAMVDLAYAKMKYPELNIISQHVDATKNPGSTTGWTPAETLLGLGINMTLLNHSEHRAWNENIVEDIKNLQTKGIKVVLCCENTEEAIKCLEAQPFAIAYEPKDLIGSGISVTTRPEAVTEFIKESASRTNALIGAGVSTGEDVKSGLDLGAKGALLASAFVKAADPKAKLIELISPML